MKPISQLREFITKHPIWSAWILWFIVALLFIIIFAYVFPAGPDGNLSLTTAQLLERGDSIPWYCRTGLGEQNAWRCTAIEYLFNQLRPEAVVWYLCLLLVSPAVIVVDIFQHDFRGYPFTLIILFVSPWILVPCLAYLLKRLRRK